MRLHEYAAHRYSSNGLRELQRSGGYGALANAHRYVFTDHPLPVLHASRPILAGHQPRLLAGQINSSAFAQADLRTIVGHTIDSQPQADVVEKYVARFRNRLLQTNCSVAFRVPAMKHAS